LPGGTAAAQTAAAPSQTAAGSPDVIPQRAQELETARQQGKSKLSQAKADITSIAPSTQINSLIDIAPPHTRGGENSISDPPPAYPGFARAARFA